MADSNTTTKLIDLDNLSTYHSLMDAKKEEHSIILTLAQYNALTPEEKMNGKTYYISDAGSSGMVITASDVLMTGYSKASSASAITTNDTGSIAFGKLEKGLEDTNSLIPSSATTSNKLATAADIPGVATASAVGLVKPDGTTITVDANGTITASADLTNYIQKSQTTGLVKNDGTIDTSKHISLIPTGKGPLNGNLSPKTWSGYTPEFGQNVWEDGDNIYYSSASAQKVLDKSTGTWSNKIWNGYTNIDRYYLWTDGDNIYYSLNATQYVLDKTTSTWTAKTWNGLSSFDGSRTWTDGDNIYYSNGSSNQYVLNKSTSTWSTKTWNEYTDFYGNSIWTDGDNIYYSSGSIQKVLNKSTSTWNNKTWSGLTSFGSNNIWTDGDNIYYSFKSIQKVLNKSTSTWSNKTWTGLTSFNSNNIWTDGINIYYSSNTDQYIFDAEAIYADGYVMSDGTIDTNSYAQESVVGTVENGTTASQAYAVGEHFIRNDKFCTCISAIASGATLTQGTNYVEGTIADNLNVKDYSSHVTLNNNITWLSANTNFTRIGNVVYFTVRGTFPASVSNSYNIFTLDQDVMVGETYNTLLSSSWGTPQILGVLDCYSYNAQSRCEVAGQPSLGNKAFVCTGHFLIKN